MKERIIGFVLIIFFSLQTYGQPSYLVGTGQSSIEPDKSLISLALSGYAAPMEGRFSLHWLKKEQLPAAVSLAGTRNNLFIISNGELLSKSVTDDGAGWKTLGKADDIVTITGTNDKLFAVTGARIILESDTRKISWTKLSTVDKSVTSVAIAGNNLYAGSPYGMIYRTDLSDEQHEWKSFVTLKDIISLASLNDDLFALTGDGKIFKCRPGINSLDWTKIAYRNNVTIKEDIRHITIADNGIFGISKENILYEGNHRSEGNLTVRAIAIKNRGKIIVIVNIDLVSLTDKYLGMLKNEIRKKYNIEPSAVLMNLSHTHFAPVVMDWPTWMEYNHHPNQTYIDTVVKNGILSAVDKALASASPAKLYFGRGKTDIGYNRSLKDHPELYDSAVDVLKVKYEDNRESYVFLASCHPVFSTAGKLHYTLSANYPGVARKLVEGRTNTGNSIFLQGTAGDINPRDNGQYITGEKLSNEVISVLNRSMEEVTGPLTYYLDTINIRLTPLTREELTELKSRSINNTGDIGAVKNVNYADLMMAQYDKGTIPLTNPVYVQTINIGNWKIVGFSRETTSEYALGVKELFPGQLVSVAGYSNDVSSYLPTNLHVQKRNYEGFDSFLWYGAMPFPVTVNETVMNDLKKLKR